MTQHSAEKGQPLTDAELDAVAVEAFGYTDTFLAYQAAHTHYWRPRHALSGGAVAVAQAAARLARTPPAKPTQDTP